MDAVLKSFGSRIHSIDHLDGVTVDLGDGSWFNLRSSNTEPLLRLNVEGRSTEDVDAVVAHVSAEIDAQSAPRRRRGRAVNATRAIDLEDTEGLLAADREGLLRAASSAGAQVRAIAAAADEGALDSLRADDRAAQRDLGGRPRNRRDRRGHAGRDVGRCWLPSRSRSPARRRPGSARSTC